MSYNRHVGLRLPWTVSDEETWNLAHRVLGIITLPLAIAYFVLSLLNIDFDKLSMIIIGLWVGIPSVISLIYYWKKFRAI